LLSSPPPPLDRAPGEQVKVTLESSGAARSTFVKK
jgi:hypothetical protein